MRRLALLALILLVSRSALADSLFTKSHEARTSVRASSFAAASKTRAEADVRTLARGAELIFEGRIVDIETRLSKPGPGLAQLPHYFVTYQVLDVIHGSIAGRSRRHFTLRLLGGEMDGLTLEVPHNPEFAVGDRDILMVTGNGELVCPLVGCTRGRFRIAEDRVFTDRWSSIEVDARGRAYVGAKREAVGGSRRAATMRSAVTAYTARREGDRLYGGGATAHDPVLQMPASAELDPSAFKALIRGHVGSLSTSVPAASLDPRRSFTIQSPAPTKPAPSDVRKPAPSGAIDRLWKSKTGHLLTPAYVPSQKLRRAR